MSAGRAPGRAQTVCSWSQLWPGSTGTAAIPRKQARERRPEGHVLAYPLEGLMALGRPVLRPPAVVLTQAANSEHYWLHMLPNHDGCGTLGEL